MTPEQIEHANAISSYRYAMAKDTPAKRWFFADLLHPAIFRALKIDQNEDGASYAVMPFRLAKIDGVAHILAAWPCPPTLANQTDDWLDIEVVLAWNPVANTVHVMGQDNFPQIVGAFHPSKPRLFAPPFTFFRAWVEHRAAFFTAWRAAKSAHWLTTPAENDTPGALLVGALKDIRWSEFDLPQKFECVGIDPKEVNKAILRGSSIPFAIQPMRFAA